MFLRSTVLASIVLVGCGESSPNEQAAKPAPVSPTPAAPSNDVFVSARPADAPGITEAKKSAKKGETVRFLGRIGGKKVSFIDGNAIFIAADPSLVSCELMGDEDHCSVPWDYCCEDGDALREGTATIQIVDGSGKPLRQSAKGMGGLDESKFVLVEGVVQDRNDEGVFIVNAKHIWVGGKPTRADRMGGSM
ncbi:MAG: hypothetical protein GY894_07385 [Planctomycetes bacterium]|jgi:hypothetical protein|nr:hypothetical protein [Planctomycetota bacterium]